MKLSRVTRVLAIAFVLVFSGAAVTTANAQHRHFHNRVVVVQRPFFPHYYWGYPSYYGYYDPIAYQREEGYRDGLSRGKDDAKHGRADSPASHKHYSNSDSLTYRQAFVQGYEDGYKARMG